MQYHVLVNARALQKWDRDRETSAAHAITNSFLRMSIARERTEAVDLVAYLIKGPYIHMRML
jgi:hypothetical protein